MTGIAGLIDGKALHQPFVHSSMGIMTICTAYFAFLNRVMGRFVQITINLFMAGLTIIGNRTLLQVLIVTPVGIVTIQTGVSFSLVLTTMPKFGLTSLVTLHTNGVDLLGFQVFSTWRKINRYLSQTARMRLSWSVTGLTGVCVGWGLGIGRISVRRFQVGRV